jgi:hypothetical protein
MFLAIAIVLERYNMKFSKARWQFSHRDHADTNLIPAQPFTFMIPFFVKKHLEFSMHRCRHITSQRYFNNTPHPPRFGMINCNGMAALLSRPEPAASVERIRPNTIGDVLSLHPPAPAA